MADLTQTPVLAGALEQNLKKLRADLQTLIRVLTYPKTVADDLKKLNTILTTTSNLLVAVALVPEIEAEATTLRRAIDALNKEVEPAKNAAVKLEARVKPVREALQKLQPPLDSAIKTVDRIATTSQNFLNKFLKVRACVESLPDGSVKTKALQYLADFSRTATPPAVALNTALKTTNSAIEAFYEALQKIESKLSFLEGISSAIDKVLSVLSPLLGPLKALEGALDIKIHIPTPVPVYHFTVTVREILEEFKQFEDLALKVLEPFLKALPSLNIHLPSIPGLDDLINLRLTVPRIPDVAQLFSHLATLFDALKAQFTLFKLSCPPKGKVTAFPVQLKKHMRDVIRHFEDGGWYGIEAAKGLLLTVKGDAVVPANKRVGKNSRFRVSLDASHRVVLETVRGQVLNLEQGSLVPSAGPPTQAAHLKVVPQGRKGFSLSGPRNRYVEYAGKRVFRAVPTKG